MMSRCRSRRLALRATYSMNDRKGWQESGVVESLGPGPWSHQDLPAEFNRGSLLFDNEKVNPRSCRLLCRRRMQP